MSNYLARLRGKISCTSLFPLPPTIEFWPKEESCHDCHSALKVQKTHTRKVVTLQLGQFYAKETVLMCKKCKRTYQSEQLCQLVSPGSIFGYDVLVFVGKALFLRCRNDLEVVVQLAEKNVQISEREISYLGKKFVTSLAIAHQQCTHKIKEAMQLRGGYILHLDGTCEGPSPVLMSGLDSLSKIVLGNVKLPSEKKEKIISFLKKIKGRFGTPIAVVNDMSASIIMAVKEAFPKRPNFICHYHFLRDIGKDLMLSDYNIIKKRLSTHGITAALLYRAKQLLKVIDKNPEMIDVLQLCFHKNELSKSSLELIPTLNVYTLILWTLEGKNQGNGYGFPFDRLHLDFANRLKVFYLHIDELKEIKLRQVWNDNKPYYKIFHILKTVMKDKVLWETVETIESKIEVFDKLRDAMRIAPKSGKEGLNHDGLDTDIQTIKKQVTTFRDWLISKNKKRQDKEYKNMIAQMNKYWEKLFADPIIVNTLSGKIQIQPQRTNNILERFFRDIKRGNRRKTGNDSSAQFLRTMLAETPLVKNLQNPEYMNILFDGKESIEEVFAEIEITKLRNELRKAQQNHERIPAKIKRIIAEPEYPERIAELVKNSVK